VDVPCGGVLRKDLAVISGFFETKITWFFLFFFIKKKKEKKRDQRLEDIR
jgi:hypothetical protein